MEKPHWSKIDVQVQPETETQKYIAGMLIPRYPGVTEGANEDGVGFIPESGERSGRVSPVRR